MNVVGTAIHFWQRAYIKERDRQELIFTLKTAIDDFKHSSSRFYALFIDFRDASGSINQDFLIQTLLECNIEKVYIDIIADIYQSSQFQIICGESLSKEFPLSKGTKPGCQLSALLFVIILDKCLKKVYIQAITERSIQNNSCVTPLPVSGYADDINMLSDTERLLQSMLQTLCSTAVGSNFDIRTGKCFIFYER